MHGGAGQNHTITQSTKVPIELRGEIVAERRRLGWLSSPSPLFFHPVFLTAEFLFSALPLVIVSPAPAISIPRHRLLPLGLNQRLVW
jgi:hypothetical protein